LVVSEGVKPDKWKQLLRENKRDVTAQQQLR
jgi:hypothetical protein